MIDYVQTSRPKQRPNILFIITDQQRADAVGYVNPLVVTPNLNALAAESVVCGNVFVQSPQCQPSRVSIWTGRYPTAHRVWWNETLVPYTEQTIGNYLHKVGYNTGYFGKLHFLGHGSRRQVANYFGFQECFLFEDWGEWVSARSMALKGVGPVEAEFHGPMGTNTWVGEFTRRELHHEEVVTGKAIEFMRKSVEPWFAVVGFHGPHPPYASPGEFSSLYRLEDMGVPSKPVRTYTNYLMGDDDWRRLKRQYFGAVSWIDDCVGRLVRAAGPDTVVVFTSDHGDILGDHGYFSKGLFAYDGNVKVPLLMRLPGVRPVSYDWLVQSIDIVPTLLHFVGVAPPRGVQGLNLLPGFVKDMALQGSVGSMIGHFPRLRMVRTVGAKYWVYGEEEMLFDLVSDPGELVNVVSSHPELLSRMRREMVRMLVRAEDSLPFPT